MAPVVKPYDSATVSPLAAWSLQPARPLPKVKRPCSSVARTVEATVITALASAKGTR